MMVAKNYKDDKSRIVRYPEEYRFDTDEAMVNRIEDTKNVGWNCFMEAIEMFSDDFMEEREEL